MAVKGDESPIEIAVRITKKQIKEAKSALETTDCNTEYDYQSRRLQENEETLRKIKSLL